MKKLSFLLTNALLATALLFTSCGDEEDEVTPGAEITVDAFVPSITPTADSVVANSDSTEWTVYTTDSSAEYTLAIAFTIGAENKFETVQICQDGDCGAAIDDASGEKTYAGSASAVVAVGETVELGFSATDKDAASKKQSVELSVVLYSATTPLTETEGTMDLYALKNAGGPVGTGGLDLDNGASTGSSDDAAELADAGLDASASDLATNWNQMIKPANDAMLYAAEGFDYANATVESLEAFLADAESIDMSDKVAEGDVFVVVNGDNKWVLEVADVVVTSDDNTDHYVFNVKK